MSFLWQGVKLWCMVELNFFLGRMMSRKKLDTRSMHDVFDDEE